MNDLQTSTYSHTINKLWQGSPQALAHPVVAPSDLTQVTDLLTLFVGVVSSIPQQFGHGPLRLTRPLQKLEVSQF